MNIEHIKESVLVLVAQLCQREGVEPERPNPVALDEFVRRHGLGHVHELREWLELCNGANIGEGGLLGVGTRAKHLDLQDVYERRVGQYRGMIPLAGDGCGSYYCLDTAHRHSGLSPVVFAPFDEPSERWWAVGSSLWRFLHAYLTAADGDTGLPFDRSVLELDPELEEVTEWRRPWEVD